MIHATYNTDPTYFYVTPEERSVVSGLDRTKTWLLFKFQNDMDKRTVYGYPKAIVDYPSNANLGYRYTRCEFDQVTTQASEDVYTGKVNFKPYGYWSYHIYEVHWAGGLGTSNANLVATKAPIDEDDTYHPSTAGSDLGVVQGTAMEEGKLYVSEKDPAQITYTQKSDTAGTNYIWTK